MKLVQPWPEGYTVNARSPYGPRVHPITGRRKFHHGVDVALPVGTELRAPADGTIVHKGNSSSGGYTLIVRHGFDLHTVYYHLQKSSERRRGDKVLLGEVIAHSGNTGASTGPHLHWEVRKSRKWGDTVDPMPYLTKADLTKPEPVVVEEPVSEPEPVKIAEPKPVPRLPMSAKLARFFRIRRALR
jgi:murein DD-endopeptidase MepM/ murein hydrolase activator NlpD